jgi:hypothetical protein
MLESHDERAALARQLEALAAEFGALRRRLERN